MKDRLPALDAITDKVLSYQKKQKSKLAKRTTTSEVSKVAARKNKSAGKAKAMDQ